jgi:aminopeptidase N
MFDEASKKVSLDVKQTQKLEGHVGLFRVPVEVAITTASGEKLFPIEVAKADETFTFAVDGPPLMVLFDKGDKILKSVDFQKSPEDWMRQLRNASEVPDRADAALALGNLRDSETVVNALGDAAEHDYVISATDFLGAAAKIANRDYRLVEMYTFAAAVYFVISFSLSLLVKRLQTRIAVIR